MNETQWSEKEKTWFKTTFYVSDKTITQWQNQGFSLSEAVDWSHWGVNPTRATQYIKDGIEIPVYSLNSSGMSLNEALKWTSSGFEMDEAQRWSELGVKYENAILLKNKGVNVYDISEFGFWGISITQAIKWLAADIDADTAKDWIDWKVNCDKAKRFAADGITEPPADEFREAGLTLAEALKWTKAGIDYFTAEDWIYWKVPTDKAIELALKGEWPPGDEFKESGLTFQKAMEWISDFSEDEIEFSENQIKTYWKPWFEAGFSVQSAKSFQMELIAFVENAVGEGLLARKKPFNYNVYREEDHEVHLKLLLEESVKSITNLHTTGMKVTIENAVLWRSMTSSQILACIDRGIDADTGYRLGDSVLSAHQVEMHTLLTENGFSRFPGVFINLGLTITDLQKLVKLKIDLDEFANVCSLLKLDGPELVKWAKVFKGLVTKVDIIGLSHRKAFIAEWINAKFSPKDAWAWHSEGFSAGKARSWIDSGVKDPAVASRRKNAGLEPK